MRVAEVVGRVLHGLGARYVFGVVGSGNFHVTNALVAAGARFVAAAHEGGAASMADGYARTAATVGLLSVHQGPGVTNALTGLTEAAKSRTPMVVLAPEATAPRSNFFLDLPGLAASVGATSIGYARRTRRRTRLRLTGPPPGARRWCWPCRWRCRAPEPNRGPARSPRSRRPRRPSQRSSRCSPRSRPPVDRSSSRVGAPGRPGIR
ncbi:thiamine pyrophosphate-binding protein [Micromonospora tarensis]|uniref:Thiamine pyrophosphate enzyme N-terminal TPP-binding domain-containing protein n=1 Tax=Micromonospora tarensis TaxID=2806100 RepID=A0ABS1YF50_9ACTN|nr:thiamine pyrophosphate-binding protein [Micromonospora tarensis]MBM0276049.1 hypothetical protein [Micromonospora tarensis]